MFQHVFPAGVVFFLLCMLAGFTQLKVSDQRIVYKDPVTKQCVGVKEGRNVSREACATPKEGDGEVILSRSMTLEALQKTFR